MDQNDNKEEEKGYLGNMLVRILDNLQLTIKNIHIRFEDTELADKPYSLGISL